MVNSATGETVYIPPSAHDVPIMMAELVDWLNQGKEVHPVLVSGISQFQAVGLIVTEGETHQLLYRLAEGD